MMACVIRLRWRARCLSVAVLLLSVLSFTVHAQNYPSKAVRIVVPFSAGSVSDAVARVLAQELSKELGAQFVVDNRAGANSIIGAESVANAAPDGYTLLMPSNTALAANVSLYKKLPYDPVKDFTPIMRLGNYPFFLLVNPKVPAKTVPELIAYARANPGKLNYATSNSLSLVGAETFNVLATTKFMRVPYKANPQALADLMNGHVHMMVADIGTALPHVKAGKLRALGVTPAKRTRLAPGMASVAESGLPGFDLTGWVGLVGPAKLPPAIVNKLHATMMKILQKPEVRTAFDRISTEIAPSNPEEFTIFIKQQIDEWAKLVRAAGIEAE